MPVDLSPLTIFLMKAFGIYMVVGGSTGIFTPARWGDLLDDFEKSPALAFMGGFFIFALGATIIYTHNVWTSWQASFVSLVGWAAAIEGLVIIAAPGPLFRLCKAVNKPRSIFAFATLSTIGGVALTFAAFMA